MTAASDCVPTISTRAIGQTNGHGQLYSEIDDLEECFDGNDAENDKVGQSDHKFEEDIDDDEEGESVQILAFD